MAEESGASYESGAKPAHTGKDGGTPPPTTPDSLHTEIGEGDISKVTVKEIQRGILLPDWDAVESVLNMYGSGRVTAGVGAELATLSDVGEHGLEAFDIYREFKTLQGPTGTFIDGFMDDARSQTDERGIWRRHFDYDGVGTFQKTNLTIEKAPEGSGAEYVLGIYSGRAGDEPEQEIAEILGIERPIVNTEIQVEFTPDGDHFSIDMDRVAARLSPLFGEDGSVSGGAIADHFMSYDRHGSVMTNDYDVGEVDGFGVYSNFRNVHYRSQSNVWEQDGATLSGPLSLRDYRVPERGYKPASLVFRVADASGDWHKGTVQRVFNQEGKDRMRQVTQQVADTFQPKAA